MPTISISFTSISAGDRFGSTRYSTGPARLDCSWMLTLPSAVNSMVRLPAATVRSSPSLVPFSATHTPTRDGGSFLASFVAGAPTERARAASRDGYMSQLRAVVIGPRVLVGDPTVIRPSMAQARAGQSEQGRQQTRVQTRKY